MSMDFAGSFINALQAGQQNAQQRRRQNALMGAGQMAANGNAGGGVNALLRGGYWDDAAQLTQFGEKQRRDQTRERMVEAYKNTQGNEAARLTAAGGVAAEQGDFEGMAQLREMAMTLSQPEKEELAKGYQFFATTAATLAGQNLPPEQAKAQAIQMLRQSPYGQSEAIQQIEAMPVERFTPQALNGYAQTYGMSAAEVLGERTRQNERQQDIRREDDRFNKSYQLQLRQVRNSENAPRAMPPLRGNDKGQMERVQTSAEASRGMRGLVQEFASYLDKQNTGPVSGATVNPARYLDTELQAMNALASRMTGLMRPVGSGATSDFEQRLYARGAPSVDKTREANREIIAGLEKLAAIADARQFFFENYAADNNGSLLGAEERFQQSPEFRQLTQGASDPAAGNSGTQRRRFNPATGRVE